MSSLIERLNNLLPERLLYTLRDLPYHLVRSDRRAEFFRILTTLDFLYTKIVAFGPEPLIEDFAYSDEERLETIEATIRLSAHILRLDPSQLASQLCGRLLPQDEATETLLHQAEEWHAVPWVRPLTPSLTRPGDGLVRTITIPDELRRDEGTNGAKVAITSDGRYAVLAVDFRPITIWDMDRGALMQTLDGTPAMITELAVSANGTEVLCVSGQPSRGGILGKTLRRWNLADGTEGPIVRGVDSLAAPALGGVQPFALAKDGLMTAQRIAEGMKRTWKASIGWLSQVVLTPNGRHAILISDNTHLSVYDVETGKKTHTFSVQARQLRGLLFARDSKRAIAILEDETLIAYDLHSGREVMRVHGLSSLLAVTIDGKHTVCKRDAGLRVVDLESQADVKILDIPDRYDDLKVTTDGRFAVSASRTALKFWDLEITERIGTNTHRVMADTASSWPTTHAQKYSLWTCDSCTAVALNGNGRRLLLAQDEVLTVWTVKRGAEFDMLCENAGVITSMAITINGQSAVSCSPTGIIKVWDLKNGTEKTSFGVAGKDVRAIGITTDGRRALICVDDRLGIWDLRTTKQLSRGFRVPYGPNGVVCAADGENVAALNYWSVEIWNVENDRKNEISCAQTIPPIGAVALSSEARRVLALGSNGAVLIWDFVSRTDPVTLPELVGADYRSLRRTLAVIPEGSQAVTTSTEVLTVWNLDTLSVIARFTGDASFDSCTVVSAGDTIVVREQSGRIHLLKIESV